MRLLEKACRVDVIGSKSTPFSDQSGSSTCVSLFEEKEVNVGSWTRVLIMSLKLFTVLKELILPKSISSHKSYRHAVSENVVLFL